MVKKGSFRADHGELIADFFWRSFQLFGKYAVGIVIFFISAKLLTPYNFGVYNYVMAIAYTIALFSDFGISLAMSRFVTQCLPKSPDKVPIGVFHSILIILSLSTLLALSVFLLGETYFSRLLPLFWYVFPLFYLMPLTALYDGVFRGHRKFQKLSTITAITGIITLPIIYCLILYMGLPGALLSQTIFYLLLFGFLFLGYPSLTVSIDWKIFWEILSYSLLVGVGIFAQLLNAKIDVIMLEWYSFVEEISYYEIANKIVHLLVMPAFIFASVIAPRSTEAMSQKQMLRLKRDFRIHTTLFFLIAIPIGVIVYSLFPFLIGKVLPEYTSPLLFTAFHLLVLLLPLRYFYSLVSTGYMLPCGFAFLMAGIGLFSGIINVIGNLILIEKFGFIGVVYATMIAGSVSALLSLIGFYWQMSRVKLPATNSVNEISSKAFLERE